MLEVELLIRNKKSQYLIRYMLDKVGADLDHGLVKFDNSEGWSKFSFQDKQGLKCPFSQHPDENEMTICLENQIRA